jgi:hypothetical protein
MSGFWLKIRTFYGKTFVYSMFLKIRFLQKCTGFALKPKSIENVFNDSVQNPDFLQ